MEVIDNSGTIFFDQQIRGEQKLSGQLNLKEKTLKKLLLRHTLHTIKAFQSCHEEDLKENYILYMLPSKDNVHWRLANKQVHTLDDYSYCLLNKLEYKRAIQDNLPKGDFIDLRAGSASSSTSSSNVFVSVKKEPQVTPEQASVEVVNDIFDTIGVRPKEKTRSLKHPSTVATHLGAIISFGGVSRVEEDPYEERTIQVKKNEKNLLRAIEKEYEKKIILQEKRHRVELIIATKKAAGFSLMIEKLRQANDEKDAEITRLKHTRVATTVASKPRSPTKKKATTTTKKGTKAHQQQELPVGEGGAPVDPEALAEAERRAAEERIAEQRQIAEANAVYDTIVEASLRAYSEQGKINIGLDRDSYLRLQAYLTKFLEATRAPNANQSLHALLDHHFLINYRLSFFCNMSTYATNSDYMRNMLEMQRSSEVMNTKSFPVRYNLSNVLVHTSFLLKAIEFSETPSMMHKPIILSNFQCSYALEIIQKWYPNVNSGNGFIITPDFKIAAVASLQGQGHNKHCCYCGLQYIACSNGVLKHAHQVKNCDYIANNSNDERMIIQAVLSRALVCQELREHDFISKRNVKSLFRVATPEEDRTGLYVISPLSGEHLRINMPVLMAMRERTYLDMIARITSLDTHKVEMNLNAKPFSYQLDCFGLGAPRLPKKKKTTKTENGSVEKIQKEDGFLFKTLIDYDGNQFRRSKFTPDGKKSLRDFTIGANGFGDDMYFSLERVLTQEEIDQEVNRQLMMNMMMIEAPPQQQQVLTQEEINQEVNRQLMMNMMMIEAAPQQLLLEAPLPVVEIREEPNPSLFIRAEETVENVGMDVVEVDPVQRHFNNQQQQQQHHHQFHGWSGDEMPFGEHTFGSDDETHYHQGAVSIFGNNDSFGYNEESDQIDFSSTYYNSHFNGNMFS